MKIKIFTPKNVDSAWGFLTLTLCLLLTWALTLTGLTYGIKNIFINNVIKDTPSPNDKYKAVAFIRSGGEALDYSPQVSILEGGEELGNNHTGNVFIGYGNHFLDAYWENNTTLVVVHNCTAGNIFVQEDQINDIKIVYKLRS